MLPPPTVNSATDRDSTVNSMNVSLGPFMPPVKIAPMTTKAETTQRKMENLHKIFHRGNKKPYSKLSDEVQLCEFID